MLRVRTVWSGVAGAPFYTNHFFQGGDDQAAAQDAADAVNAVWSALAGSLVNDLTAHVEGDVFKINMASGQPEDVFSVNGVDHGFTSTGNPLPWFTQYAVKFNTGVFINGRALVGRTYIPGWPVSAADVNGRPVGGVSTTVSAAFSPLINDSANFGVWSRKNAQWASLTGLGLPTEFSTLRSRRD